MKLKLIKKERLDQDIYLFTFEPPAETTWKAGQQMQFTLPHPHPDNLGVERTLSIASAPFEGNIAVITHCGDQGSTFKKALREMNEGDEIEASEPWGDFVVNDPNKTYTFIASGVGIGAFRSILTDLDYHNQPMNITLIYSHSSEDFPFKEEIEELLERHSNFKVFYTINPEEKERGRIKEVITGLENHPIYMSGIYIRKVAELLDYRDVKPQRIVHDGRLSHENMRSQEIKEEENYLMNFWGE